MKKFNLDEALKGAKVVSECGYPVKIAGFNPDANTYDQVAGWMNGSVYRWSKDGEYSHNDPFRLFMAPTERKEWVIIWRDKEGNPEQSSVCSEKPNLPIGTMATLHEITITE